jgi:hypothetical protein
LGVLAAMLGLVSTALVLWLVRRRARANGGRTPVSKT